MGDKYDKLSYHLSFCGSVPLHPSWQKMGIIWALQHWDFHTAFDSSSNGEFGITPPADKWEKWIINGLFISPLDGPQSACLFQVALLQSIACLWQVLGVLNWEFFLVWCRSSKTSGRAVQRSWSNKWKWYSGIHIYLNSLKIQSYFTLFNVNF